MTQHDPPEPLDDRQSVLAHLDEENYRHQRHYLREVGIYRVGVLAIETYEAGRAIVNGSPVSERDDILFGVAFFMRSQYALEKGMTEILRLHFGDTMGIIRQVVEGAAFADRVRRHPHLAMTWLNAVTDDEGYAVYRDKFGPAKLFPDDDPLLVILGTWFDWASKHIHGSPFSFGTHLSMPAAGCGQRQLLFSYVDVKDERSGPRDLVRMYLAYLTVQIAVLDVFARVFRDALQHDRGRWDVAYGQFEASLLGEKRRLAPALLPRAAPTTETDGRTE